MQQHNDTWLNEEPVVISVREVDYNPLEEHTQNADIPFGAWLPRKKRLWLALLSLGLALALFAVGAFGLYSALPEQVTYMVVPHEEATDMPFQAVVEIEPMGVIAPLFTDEVMYWEADIARWAEQYDLDPNLIATVMQIESCGDPTAGSSAGAQGLFQVMPFHFLEGENPTDPETNALRGMNYLAAGLDLANGDVGLALAGYNGGHGVITLASSRWYAETQRYYYWGLGIYQDALAGLERSDRLDEWLANNGQSLCDNAARVQRTLQ